MPDLRFEPSSFSSLVSITAGSGVGGASDLPETCDGLLVGVAGTATLKFKDGTTVASVPLVAGYNPLRVKRISAATATGLFAGYFR